MKKNTLSNLLQKNNLQKGFVILFTILISAIVLMIGLGIFSIATRETVLSGTAREAQYAFYAADAGIECALYAESIPGGPFTPLGHGTPFNCGEAGSISVAGATGTSELDPFTFHILVGTGQDKTCATVSVFDFSTSSGHPARRVISQGYNVCNPDGTPATNPILVERNLDTMYETGVLVPITPVTPTPTPINTSKTPTGTLLQSATSFQQTLPANLQKLPLVQ